MKMKSPNKTRISRLTIGRLYNLGNYEHVRYEITVEVPNGESPRTALHRIMFVLKAANPKPPVQEHEYAHAQSILSEPQAWHKNIADKKERAKAIKELVTGAKQTVASWEKWKLLRRRGLALLDEFGATRSYKDHKEDWDDDYEL
jgi:hypothetical protein